MARLRATVEYDGTAFYGFQLQAQGRTVQGELERALRQVTGADTRVIGAGRTDRGVHARGQVVAFDVEWQHPLPELHRALNAVLDDDVALVDLGAAAEGFHPRFDALSRTYWYTILIQSWRSPLERRTTWHVAYPLDLERMCTASRCLVGTHDFSSFGQPPQGENAVRTIKRAEWRQDGRLLVFEIEGNAFLRRMVRSLVGALVLVGAGQLAPREFETILLARDSSQVKQVAPAQGLCLMRVDYATVEGVNQ